jgi:hypothetical protein
VKPFFPAKACEVCDTYDWIWNPEFNKYVCVCGYIPEETSPDSWIQDTLEELNQASLVLEELNETPITGELTDIIIKGKIKKAEQELSRAGKMADVALLMNQLKIDTKHGEVFIKVPEVDLEVKLVW